MFEGQQHEVEVLLQQDTEFRQLYHRHRQLDRQVSNVESGVQAVGDQRLTQMKREKLRTKERLTRLFDARHAAR